LKCELTQAAVPKPSTSEESERFKQVLEDNKRLITKLELLESGTPADLSGKIDEGIRSALDNEKLKEEIDKAEKRQKKLIAAFRSTSKEFREIVYILTGYKIDVLKQKIYRLSHVYADSPTDHLLFELEGSTVKLLNNDYSAKLVEIAECYLAQGDSYPAFLAAHTLDLHKKQTTMVS
jgi:mitotic spindle assembly checkpoint protein MAD1